MLYGAGGTGPCTCYTAGGTGPRSVRTGRHQEAQQEELGQGQVGLLKWAWGMGEVEKGMGVLSVWSGQASCRRKGRWQHMVADTCRNQPHALTHCDPK